jgi:hypothetical protein
MVDKWAPSVRIVTLTMGVATGRWRPIKKETAVAERDIVTQELPWTQGRLVGPRDVRITGTLVVLGGEDVVQVGVKVEDWDTDDLLAMFTWPVKGDWVAASQLGDKLIEVIHYWRAELLPF